MLHLLQRGPALSFLHDGTRAVRFCRVLHSSVLSFEGEEKTSHKLIREHTQPTHFAELAGLGFHLITERCPLWRATSSEAGPFPAPWWGFLWPGSYALCRYIAENPDTVRAHGVLDFAAGCGAAAIVAAQHGASRVVVNDICTWALSSAQLNIALNADALLCARDDPSATSFVLEPADIIGRQFPLHITPHTRDPAAPDTDHARGTDGSNGAADVPIDVVLAGDVMYEQPLATHVMRWFRGLAAQGTCVLVGDPGRAFLPKAGEGLDRIASYELPRHVADSSNGVHAGHVWQVLP